MKNYSLKINGHTYEVSIDELNESSKKAEVFVNGTKYEVDIESEEKEIAKKPQVVPAPAATGLSVSNQTTIPQINQTAPKASASGIKSPLPGTVLSVKVNVGDSVKAGQTLVVVEAMKMENNIDAQRDGVVKSIAATAGATVAEGDELMVIE